MFKDNKSVAPVKKSAGAVKRVEGKLPFKTRLANWFREMRSELKKVIWPTPTQIANNTAIALGFMAVAAVVIWAFDKGASIAVQSLIGLVH